MRYREMEMAHAHDYIYVYVLSQVFGMYLVIMAIILGSRAEYYKKLLHDINPHGFGLMIAGSIWLLIGLFLVTIHSSWGGFARNMISILFWIIVIKSILLLAFPEQLIACSQKLLSGCCYYVMVIIIAIVGIVLMTNGYYLYM